MARKTFRRMIAKRLINVVLTIFGIMILNFCLIHFMPGDPIENVIPRTTKFDPALKWELKEKFHLNDSLPEQLVWYMYNTITLDWGTSYSLSARPVFDIIMTDIRWTLLLVGISTVIIVMVIAMLIDSVHKCVLLIKGQKRQFIPESAVAEESLVE